MANAYQGGFDVLNFDAELRHIFSQLARNLLSGLQVAEQSLQGGLLLTQQARVRLRVVDNILLVGHLRLQHRPLVAKVVQVLQSRHQMVPKKPRLGSGGGGGVSG